MTSSRLNLVSFAVLLGAICLASSAPTAFAQHPAPTRLVAPINERVLVPLTGNVRPDIAQARDLGPVEDEKPMRLMLLLKPTSAQQTDLNDLIASQQTQGDPEYHKWLTPAEFGARFGASKEDIAKLSAWLESHGFKVRGAANNARMIDFSATAGQVREAFHTQLHYVSARGGKYPALLQDPQIPAALATVVTGIQGLNMIPPRPNHTAPRQASFDKETHKWNVVNSAATGKASPEYFAGAGFIPYFLVGPQDLYTIYNVNPLFEGFDFAQNSTVAVIEESDMEFGTVDPSTGAAAGGDVNTFRSLFGVPGTLNMYVFNGYGSDTCSDPGIDPNGTGEDFEASLDAEWANTTAPGANLIFMSCSPADGGIFYSLFALVDNNLGDVLSMSYGSPELSMPSEEFAFLDDTYEEAATDGQTIVVSTGDSGSDFADIHTTGTATSGVNVSGLSASPLVTAAGGTDFQDIYDALEGDDLLTYFWSPINSEYYGDALNYVPETAWNDSCAGSLLSELEGPYTGAELCGDPMANEYGLVNGDLFGGSGGFSTVYPAPTWQSGLPGYTNPARSQPDIAGFAADGFIWGHALLACDSNPSFSSGELSCTSPDTFGAGGGTSFVAPYTAGIFALVVTAQGSRQGALNQSLYGLAKQQYTNAGTKNACYANGQTSNIGVTVNIPAVTCVFNDVTTGNNDEPCAAGATDCFVDHGGDGYGMLSLTAPNSLSVAYESRPGFDQATGLGSFNVLNLVLGMLGDLQTTQALSLSPKAGTYAGPQQVYIYDDVAGATIYYTTDGTTPNTRSAVFSSSSPISVAQNTTIKALGVASGYKNVSVNMAVYKIEVTMPTFSPGTGTYLTPQSVGISDTASGSTIWYTTDGTTPIPGISAQFTGTSIAVNQNTTIKAVASATGLANSATSYATYKLKVATPTIALATGTYFASQSASISDTAGNSTIWYTTDGSTPVPNQGTTAMYPGTAIAINQTTTLKAIATVPFWTNSAVAAAAYKLVVPTPTFSVPAGTYNSPQSVVINPPSGCGSGTCGLSVTRTRPEIAAGPAGPEIWYTTDGSTPAPNVGTSTLYSSGAAIPINSTTTLKAIGVQTGWDDSSVAAAKYTIK